MNEGRIKDPRMWRKWAESRAIRTAQQVSAEIKENSIVSSAYKLLLEEGETAPNPPKELWDPDDMPIYLTLGGHRKAFNLFSTLGDRERTIQPNLFISDRGVRNGIRRIMEYQYGNFLTPILAVQAEIKNGAVIPNSYRQMFPGERDTFLEELSGAITYRKNLHDMVNITK